METITKTRHLKLQSTKGIGGYNNSTGQNQQEGNWLNQKKPRNQGNQGNQRGGVVGRGRGGGQKLDMSHIQCCNCQRYGHYSSDCP